MVINLKQTVAAQQKASCVLQVAARGCRVMDARISSSLRYLFGLYCISEVALGQGSTVV